MWWRVGTLAVVLVVGLVLWREQPSRTDPDADGLATVEAPVIRPGPRVLDPCVAPGRDDAPVTTDPRLWPTGPSEVLFTYTLTEPAGRLVRSVSLDDLGRVVVVQRDGPLSADELRTTLLAPAAADRLEAMVGAAAAAGGDGPTDVLPTGALVATVARNGGTVAVVVGGRPRAVAPDGDRPADVRELAGVLADLSWFDAGTEVVEPEGPWLPDEVEVDVLGAEPPAGVDPVPWPAEVVPRPEPGGGTSTYGGADVPAVLGLFGPGDPPVVEIDGTAHVLALDIRLADDPDPQAAC